jgi:PEP-CTERM motif
MRNLFLALACFAAGALLSGAALAAPSLLYQFELTRLSCFSQHATCDVRYDALNNMSIGLASAASLDGQADLLIQSGVFQGSQPFFNDGFASIGLALYPGPVRTIALDPAAYQGFGPSLDLRVGLDVSDFLQGALYANDTASEIVMGTSKAFAASWLGPLVSPDELFDPLDAHEWTGFVRSDALASNILLFTGEWQRVADVPEPGTLALLLTAMASAAWASRRRALVHAPEPAGLRR